MHTHRLSAELSQLQARKGTAGYRLEDILNTFGERGFGVFLTLLSIPSAMPVPAPGYSIPFGIVLALFGLQMAFRRPRPWLPRRARNIRITAATGEAIVSGLTRALRIVEKLVKPRFSWMESPPCIAAIGVLIVLMGALMCVPIPLTNTAPALVVLLAGIGLVEKDGLVSAAAAAAGATLLLFYAAAFFVIFHYGLQGMEELLELIRERLR